jgi:hypothetical protein
VEHLLVVFAFVVVVAVRWFFGDATIETADGRCSWKDVEGAKKAHAGGDVTTSPARQQEKRNMAEAAPLLLILREDEETIILVMPSSGAELSPCG